MTFCWSLSAFTPWKQIAWDLAVDRNWHMVQMVQSGHKGYDKEPPMPGSHPSCHLPLMQGIQEMGTARLVKFGIAAQLTKCRNALCGHWSHVGSCESIPLEPAVGAPHASARVRPMQSFESPARQMPAQSNYWADMNNQMTGGCNNEVRSRMLKVYLDFTSRLFEIRPHRFGGEGVLIGGQNSNTKCSMTFVNIAVAISALAGGGGQKRFRTETRIRWCFRHFSRIFGCLSARGYWNGILGHFGSFPAMEKWPKMKKQLYIARFCRVFGCQSIENTAKTSVLDWRYSKKRVNYRMLDWKHYKNTVKSNVLEGFTAFMAKNV